MQLSRSVLLYIAAVLSLGLAILAYCLWHYPVVGGLAFWLSFICFATLAALGDRYGLHLTHGAQIHVDTIPLFAGVLLFNPSAALLIAMIGRVFGRIEKHIPWVERVFNLGQTLVYVGGSALLLRVFTTTPWHPSGLPAWEGLLAAAAAMFLLNGGVVAGVVSLQSHTRLFKIWLEATPWALLEYGIMFAYGLLTALIVVLYPWGLVLVAVPSMAIFLTLDHTLRMEAQQTQLAQQNASLADDLSQQANQLREAYAVLEDALDAKNQMLQNVSHELRTPLVSISGYTEALQEGLYGDLTSDQLSALAIVFHNTKTMIRLVNDLLSLQALDRQQMDLHEVALTKLIHYCVSNFAKRAAAMGIDLRIECAPDTPIIRADSMRLEQAISNLLDNAIKFSPDGGQITLKVRRLDDNIVQISVTDQGIGIPEEELPRIYRRFYQVDGSRTRRFGGQGMGLAIVKRIVELHGGTIKAKSQVGQGTTFYITLPVQGTDVKLPIVESGQQALPNHQSHP